MFITGQENSNLTALYDVALWNLCYTVGYLNKFSSCYNKCIQLFFEYRLTY